MVPTLHHISRSLPLIIILQVLLLLKSITGDSKPNIASQYCINSTRNYTKNSQYQNNLNTLLKDLVSHATKTKYFNTSKGESTPSDKVFGLFFCRSDIDTRLCNDCVQSAAYEIVKRCPGRKTSLIFYKECTLRYANRYFSNHPEEYDAWMTWRSVGNTSYPSKIEQVLPSIMEFIIMNASYQAAYRGFATREADLSRGMNLYSLAQCTPDILGLQCEKCLRFAYKDLIDDCCRSQTLAILRPSCMLIYDTAPFYVLRPPPLLPSSPLSPDSGGATNKNNSVVYYIIRAGIPAAGFIVLLLCAVIAFYVHGRRKKKNNNNLEKDNATIESLQFDLESIKLATNNFSNDNWLGRGGFGIVYKVKL
ncbi:cysteine-rich receptor-like protein kinase 25 [Spinacia oleracea]|uniref:Cysteine-rich receptor-like protein kinase 25 n=1 Tax=Spinacia oleracea TaxID=3562 RepID=A0ABM3QX47_SPIOL|nr:cysteine-rich receptor-like protein kinase 25 [Spinacia oleracea]